MRIKAILLAIFLAPFGALADTIGQTLASSTPLFQETTGFDILGIASSTGTGLIKLVTGNGLAVIYDLKGWIVAGAIIGSVIFFTTRAIRLSRI